MTQANAKKLTAAKLAEFGLSNELRAKTVSFADLARNSKIFVEIHDWKPSPIACILCDFAKENGFIVNFH